MPCAWFPTRSLSRLERVKNLFPDHTKSQHGAKTMKVFMVTDMEGVAGIISFTQQSYPDGKYYEEAKKLETAEVNAAVDGLLDAGVTDILVWDGHGAGGISFEDLHP